MSVTRTDTRPLSTTAVPGSALATGGAGDDASDTAIDFTYDDDGGGVQVRDDAVVQTSTGSLTQQPIAL